MIKHAIQKKPLTKNRSIRTAGINSGSVKIPIAKSYAPQPDATSSKLVKTRTSKTSPSDLMDQLEHSINAIAWGCDALVHTLYDGDPSRIDGAVWVADKIREEAFSLQDTYKQFIQQSHSMPTS